MGVKNVVTTEFVMPTWILPYLFNADSSGLSDDEIQAAEALEKEAQRICDSHGGSHWSFAVETCDDPEFATYNDVTGHMGGEVQKVSLLVFIME